MKIRIENTYLAVIALVATVAVSAWAYYLLTPNAFWRTLATRVEAGEKSILVREVTELKWDAVCLFVGYDSPTATEVLSAAGITEIPRRHSSILRHIETTSDVRLLVFASDETVTDTIYLNVSGIYVGDTSFSIFGNKCFPFNEATFVVDGRHIYLTNEKGD